MHIGQRGRATYTVVVTVIAISALLQLVPAAATLTWGPFLSRLINPLAYAALFLLLAMAMSWGGRDRLQGFVITAWCIFAIAFPVLVAGTNSSELQPQSSWAATYQQFLVRNCDFGNPRNSWLLQQEMQRIVDVRSDLSDDELLQGGAKLARANSTLYVDVPGCTPP
jgi:hypothetical protein